MFNYNLVSYIFINSVNNERIIDYLILLSGDSRIFLSFIAFIIISCLYFFSSVHIIKLILDVTRKVRIPALPA